MCKARSFSQATVRVLVQCGGPQTVINHYFSSVLKTRELYLGTETWTLVKIQVSGPPIQRGANLPPAFYQGSHPGGPLPCTSRDLRTRSESFNVKVVGVNPFAGQGNLF